MAEDPRWNWTFSSGLTRSEQKVLFFLIIVISLGLLYQHQKGGWRQQPLVLHRAAESTNHSPNNGAALQNKAAQETPVTKKTGLLDLNVASLDELKTLPGIGAVRAETIVRYRETKGPFQRIEDLQQISGFGEKTIEALRPYLKPLPPSTTSTEIVSAYERTAEMRMPAPTSPPAESPVKININQAGVEELCTLNGIGPVLAKRIIAYRLKYGPFRSVWDLQKVRGIGPSILRNNAGVLTIDFPQ